MTHASSKPEPIAIVGMGHSFTQVADDERKFVLVTMHKYKNTWSKWPAGRPDEQTYHPRSEHKGKMSHDESTMRRNSAALECMLELCRSTDRVE